MWRIKLLYGVVNSTKIFAFCRNRTRVLALLKTVHGNRRSVYILKEITQTMQRLDSRGVVGQSPAGASDLSLLQSDQTGCGAHPASDLIESLCMRSAFP
jgi:hypothetical protein